MSHCEVYKPFCVKPEPPWKSGVGENKYLESEYLIEYWGLLLIESRYEYIYINEFATEEEFNKYF